MRNGVIEIVVDGPHNESLRFPPAGDRRIRGRLRFARVPSVKAMALQPEYGDSIPGQIIGYDGENGYIKEPLQEELHRCVREKLADRLNCRFADAREDFPLADGDAKATWLFWMERAVESGHARLVAGQFPKELPGTPRKSFFRHQPNDGQAREVPGGPAEGDREVRRGARLPDSCLVRRRWYLRRRDAEAA